MEFLITSNILLLIVTIIVNLGLGLFIFLKDRKNEINKSFSILLFLISFWAFSFLMFVFVRSPEWVLFWRRITPCGSALIAGYFLYFSIVFPKGKTPLSFFQKIFVLGPGYIFAVLSIFSPLLVDSFVATDPKYTFLGTPNFGPLYKVFTAYLMLYFSYALFCLFFKFLKSEKQEKLQIFYVLIGMGLSTIAGITVSLLLPIFGVSQLFTVGPPFTLIMTGFITYAIVKYRLLGIEDFLSRGLNFLLGTATVIAIFVFLIKGRIDLLLPFLLILIQIALGLYVFIKNPKSEKNFSFSMLCFSFSFWSFATFMLYNSQKIADAILWGRYIFFGPILILYFFLYFSFVFPRKTTAEFKIKKALLFIPTVFFLFITPGPLILKTAVLGPEGPIPTFGGAYPIFAIYTLTYFLYGLFNLVQKYLKARGVEKTQIRYVFLGLFLAFFFGIITNLVFPAIGAAQFGVLGPYFSLFLIGFTMYAILKHRLMSIELVVQRGLIYTILTTIIVAIYALVVLISTQFFQEILGFTSIAITGLAAFLIAVTYQPIVRFLQKSTDRLFFRGRYDYQETLRSISQAIATKIKMEELTRLIVSSFIDTMHVSEISFLILDKDRGRFYSVPIELKEGASRYKRLELDEKSPIILWLKECRDVLVLDELEDEISKCETFGKEKEKKKKALLEAKDEMEQLGVYVWVPIISENELTGIISLGSRLSGDIFTAEDIGLLATLANQTSLALENAKLYEEVVNMKNYNEEILESMVSGLLTVDVQGKITTFNSMAERLTGFSANNVIGKNFADVFSQKSKLFKTIRNCLNNKTTTNYETEIFSSQKQLIPVSISSTVLIDSHERKIGGLISFSDMTEVRELQNKLRQADKVRALSTLAAGMAHEIKNPLSSMKVFSQLLPLKFSDAEFREKFLQVVPQEIGRIDRIVESMLGFARSTAPKFERINLEKMIEENLRYFEEQAKESKIEIVKKFAFKGDLEIEADENQLSQVFANLFLNAIQAMPEGGTLTIKTREGKKIEDILQTVVIEVSDTGHGISQEHLQKLFDPFFTTKYAGTGLGLTITHSIVDGHRGFIDASSEVGKGTTFVVTLPVSQELV